MISEPQAARASIDQLIDFARSDQPLPLSVERFARGIILDTAGALIQAASPRYTVSRILFDFARQQGGTAEASIVGAGFQTSCIQAALVNGTLGYYCDVEAHHPRAIMHGAAIVVPAALAVGERQRVGGDAFLRAVVVGMDVACRVSNAIDPTSLYRRGLHPSCVAGSFGATAAAGRLLGLDREQFRRAFGLTGTQASGLLAWETDPTEHSRPFNPGIASRNGTTAALLASFGLGGPPDIFDGHFNVLRAFGEQHADGSWGRPMELTRGLGEDFLITGYAIKLYSCCAFLHPGLDALLSILQTHRLQAEDIATVDLRFPTNGVKLIDNNELKSHCAQYILPIAIVDRQVTIDDILWDRRTDPRIDALSQRIRVLPDDTLDRGFPERYTTIVEVTTWRGERFSERVDYARGTPENPVGDDVIRSKFMRLTTRTIGRERAERIAGRIDALGELAHVGELATLLSEPASEEPAREAE